MATSSAIKQAGPERLEICSGDPDARCRMMSSAPGVEISGWRPAGGRASLGLPLTVAAWGLQLPGRCPPRQMEAPRLFAPPRAVWEGAGARVMPGKAIGGVGRKAGRHLEGPIGAVQAAEAAQAREPCPGLLLRADTRRAACRSLRRQRSCSGASSCSSPT